MKVVTGVLIAVFGFIGMVLSVACFNKYVLALMTAIGAFTAPAGFVAVLVCAVGYLAGTVLVGIVGMIISAIIAACGTVLAEG